MKKLGTKVLLVFSSLVLAGGLLSLTGCKKKTKTSSLSSDISSAVTSTEDVSNGISSTGTTSYDSISTESNTDTKSYSLTYYNNGHGTSPDNIAKATALPSTLPVLSEEGYIFGGWYTDYDLQNKAVAGSALVTNTSLYAYWIKDTGNITKTISITDIANANGWVTQTRYTALPIDDASLSISVEGGGNTGKAYLNTKDKTTWDWRMYQTGAGATITIKSSGYIQSVVVTYTVENEGQLYYGNFLMTSGQECIVKDSKCILTVGGTSSKANGQVRITSISINYVEGETTADTKLANMRTTIESLIKTLASYATITKSNISNSDTALTNTENAIQSYTEAGGKVEDISSYDTYISCKNNIDNFKLNRSMAKENAENSLNELKAYISNESLTSDSTLTEEEYTTLKEYYEDASRLRRDYIVDFGYPADLSSSGNSYSLSDTLLDKYEEDNLTLIYSEPDFDFVSYSDNYIKNIPGSAGSCTITSGMLESDSPFVSMSFTSTFRSSELGEYKPILTSSKIIIEAPYSSINSINATFSQIADYKKSIKLYYYNESNELIEVVTADTFENGTLKLVSGSLPDNVNKLVIDASSSSNTIGLDDIKMSLKTQKKDSLLTSYYASIDDSYKGETLWATLETLTSTTHTYKTSYDDCAYLAYLTDYDTDHPGQILDFYSRLYIDGNWDSKIWTREHVFCQSRGWYGDLDQNSAGTDLHHVRPLIVNINSSRNNSQYGEIENRDNYQKTYNGTLWGYLNGDIGITNSNGSTDGVYEPLDNVKGDVARILMYLLVRYRDIMINPNGTNLGTDGNPVYYPITNNVYTPENTPEACYALLLKWNTEDPVDEYEYNRNDAVYAIQGNRNPFIDHPEYASYIWGDAS